jgi:hypothetical protein
LDGCQYNWDGSWLEKGLCNSFGDIRAANGKLPACSGSSSAAASCFSVQVFLQTSEVNKESLLAAMPPLS